MKYTDGYRYSLNEISLNQTAIKKLYNTAVLVTGASGLIGSAIVDVLIWLNRKYTLNMKIYAAGRNEERVVRRFSKWKKSSDYFFYRYDAMLSLEESPVTDFIVHGASNANPGLYASEPVETMLANFIGIKNLLELLRREKYGRLLYISSSEIYGKKKSNSPYSEDDYGYVDILNPRACYPSSKRSAETLCAAYKKEYGVDFVTVRPGHVYGPTMVESDNRAASQFFRNAKQGKDIVMKSAGMQLRSYSYVLDCVDAILTALLNGGSGEAYNISNPNSIITIRELAECIAEIGGVRVVFENPSDAERASFNMMDNSSLTSDKLESLGWKGKYSLQDGVRATLEAI